MRREVVVCVGLIFMGGVTRAQDAPKKDEGEKKPDAKAGDKGDKKDEGEKTLLLDAPAEWKAEPPREGRMVPRATYKLPAAEGDAEPAVVTLHYFGGMIGGSVDDNVKRWCGQFKQADGSAFTPETAKIVKEKKNGVEITIVEIWGTYTAASFMGPKSDPKPGFKLLAAYIQGPNGPWFARVVGPEKTVEKHRAAYTKWVESAHTGVEGEKKPDAEKKPEAPKKQGESPK